MRNFKKEFSEVAIARTSDSGNQNRPLVDILRENVNLIGGIAKYVKKTDTVFIKPNLTAGMPSDTGGTTDVFFTEAVVELVKEAGAARIIVGECSGNESRSIESLTNCGYAAMCERQNVEMADLDFAEFAEVPVKNACYKPTLRLPKIFWESDVFISVPVLKTHISVGITAAIKNSFGLIPDKDKTNAHRDSAVEKIIADIASVKPADLVFTDGRIGAEGIAGGTDFNHPVKADLILVSNDPVAADAVSARLMEQNPRIKFIQWAAEQGAGNDNLDYILMRGLSIEEAKVRFMSPAEQIEKETNGKVKINELGACSQCCSRGAGALGRYAKNPASLLNPIEVVYGPGEWDVPNEINPRTILLGDCVCEKYRGLGQWVGGCPADMDKYMETMAGFDLVCTKCEQVIRKVVGEIEADENSELAGVLPELRILASNKSVYKGRNNSAGTEDFLIAAGKCQEGYIRNHARRVHKYSDVDVTEFMVFKDGCPISEADAYAGIKELAEKIRVLKRV